MDHFEEKYTLPEMHVNSTKREKITQLSGRFTDDGLRVVLKEKDCYTIDMMILHMAMYFDRTVHFEGRCELE